MCMGPRLPGWAGPREGMLSSCPQWLWGRILEGTDMAGCGIHSPHRVEEVQTWEPQSREGLLSFSHHGLLECYFHSSFLDSMEIHPERLG